MHSRMIKNSVSLKFAMVFAALVTTTSIVQAANVGDVVTGGVGKEEMQQIENIQNEYNLKVTFAAAKGHFLSDVKIQISDMSGQIIVNTNTEGPVLLAKFMPGKYTIVATNAGGTKTQTVIINNSLKKLVIVLPEANKSDF